jgi:hypothetical protein
MSGKTSYPKMSAEDVKRNRQYEVEDAIRVLQRSEQIKSDRALMSDVKKAAAELQKVVGKPTPKKKK